MMEQQGVGEELLPSATSSPSQAQHRRSICSNCSRPEPVCLCHMLPQAPLPTKTHIIILQHPHESHHKLNTARLLPKCLLNTTTLLGRCLRPSDLDPLLHHHQSSPIYYLFPPTTSSPATTISNLPKNNPSSSSTTYAENYQMVLIVFDATWRHAKEMVSASEGFLESLGAKRVCLDGGVDERVEGGSIYDSESGLVLRKEPFGGCVTTLEAVARCLRVVEGEPNGIIVERTLIEVLREMVSLQKGFLKPLIKPRPRMVKKGKHKYKEEEIQICIEDSRSQLLG